MAPWLDVALPRMFVYAAEVGAMVVVFEVSRRLVTRLFESIPAVRKLLDGDDDEDYFAGIDDDDDGGGRQRKTDSVDEVLRWDGSDGTPCPLVETVLFFPSGFPDDFSQHPCPADLTYPGRPWDGQEHNIGRMLTVFHGAKTSVDMCMHMIRAPVLAEHVRYLASRLPQSVPGSRRKPLRILLDEPYYADKYAHLENVEVKVWTKNNSGMMHHKYFIVDGKVAVYGTANWTISAFKENDEAVVVTSDRRKVNTLAAKMEELWQRPEAEVFALAPGQGPARPRASVARLAKSGL